MLMLSFLNCWSNLLKYNISKYGIKLNIMEQKNTISLCRWIKISMYQSNPWNKSNHSNNLIFPVNSKNNIFNINTCLYKSATASKTKWDEFG